MQPRPACLLGLQTRGLPLLLMLLFLLLLLWRCCCCGVCVVPVWCLCLALFSEEAFELDGPSGMLAYLQQLLEERGHAVICVAEGAGQNLMYPSEQQGEPREQELRAGRGRGWVCVLDMDTPLSL